MAGGKYGRLIKPLSDGLMKWDAGQRPLAIGPGNANPKILLRGRDHLEGLRLNLSWGMHTGIGEWHDGMDPHVHPYPECLVFVGLDSANVNYLGAELSCSLGEEQETYTFNEPTAIVLPAGVPHGPIVTKRMYSPRGFGSWTVELSSTPDITWMGKAAANVSAEQRKQAPEGLRFAPSDKIVRTEPSPSTGKYAHLIKPLKQGIIIERRTYNSSRFASDEAPSPREGEKPGPGNSDHLVWMTGKDLEGIDASIFWGFSSQPGIWRRGVGAHVHPFDEVLAYVGIDPNDINYLGAEIELDMGEEHERHFIDKPTAVVCPAGKPHMPQTTRWVDRPFGFFAVCLSGGHETKAFD